MPADSADVMPPEHPLPRLATFELTRYRRELERALKRLPTDSGARPGLLGSWATCWPSRNRARGSRARLSAGRARVDCDRPDDLTGLAELINQLRTEEDRGKPVA